MQAENKQFSAEARVFAYSSTELESLVEARNFYRWLLDRFAPYLRNTVIEVGDEIGNFSDFLAQTTSITHLFLVEPSHNLFLIYRSASRIVPMSRPSTAASRT